MDRSVSFTKGCYTGQELVARVDSRGDNTPRRLRVVRGAGAALPGDELTHDGDAAGTIEVLDRMSARQDLAPAVRRQVTQLRDLAQDTMKGEG